MQQYLVIKCGGSIMEELPDSFFQNIVTLSKSGSWIPVIVHGGGPLISKLLQKFDIETEFINGIRVTTDDTLDIVEMVLSGSVNKNIVRKILQAGGQAYGISGVDGRLLTVDESSKLYEEYGFVGEVSVVNEQVIEGIVSQGYIPVISPLGIDSDGQRYNINGDTAAAAIAKALQAKLCIVSDIPGIYVYENGDKMILDRLCKDMTEQMLEDETISGGMIPKVKAAIDCLMNGVSEVVIISGAKANSLIDYCNGARVGTRIVLHSEDLYPLR